MPAAGAVMRAIWTRQAEHLLTTTHKRKTAPGTEVFLEDEALPAPAPLRRLRSVRPEVVMTRIPPAIQLREGTGGSDNRQVGF